jgi:hypothetical protein
MNEARVGRKRWPRGLFGAIALAVAVEVGLARASRELLHPHIGEWTAAKRDAAGRATGARVLCLGSSLVKHGVLPAVLADRTGRTAYNLALPGGSPPTSYFLLRRALEHGARPDLVVFDCNPNQLLDDPSRASREFALSRLLSARDVLDLSVQNGDLAFAGRLATAWVCPSVRMRHEVRNAALLALRGGSHAQGVAAQVHERNRRVNLGALVTTPNGAFRESSFPRDSPDRSAEWFAHPVNMRYARRLIDLAAEYHATVAWLIPPRPPDAQAYLDRTRTDVRFDAALRALADGRPNLLVVDGRRLNVRAGAFADLVHLNADGAAALSRSLGEALAAPPPRDRWVVLAPGAARPTDRRPESYDESLHAVIAAGRGAGVTPALR